MNYKIEHILFELERIEHSIRIETEILEHNIINRKATNLYNRGLISYLQYEKTVEHNPHCFITLPMNSPLIPKHRSASYFYI